MEALVEVRAVDPQHAQHGPRICDCATVAALILAHPAAVAVHVLRRSPTAETVVSILVMIRV